MYSFLPFLLGDLVVVFQPESSGQAAVSLSALSGLPFHEFLCSSTCSLWGIAPLTIVSAVSSKLTTPKPLSSGPTSLTTLGPLYQTPLGMSACKCPGTQLSLDDKLTISFQSAAPASLSAGVPLSTKCSGQKVCLKLLSFPSILLVFILTP